LPAVTRFFIDSVVSNAIFLDGHLFYTKLLFR